MMFIDQIVTEAKKQLQCTVNHSTILFNDDLVMLAETEKVL